METQDEKQCIHGTLLLEKTEYETSKEAASLWINQVCSGIYEDSLHPVSLHLMLSVRKLQLPYMPLDSRGGNL